MNTAISAEDKATLFDALLANEYDALIQLDLISGDATTIWVKDSAWHKSKGIRFNFEHLMERYILDHSIDPDPDAIIARLKIAGIGAALEKNAQETIYFTMRSDSGAIVVKSLSFCSAGISHAMMTMRDITETFTQVNQNIQLLNSSVQDIATQIEERNVFLTLLSRNLRAPLHSILGLSQLARDPDEIINIDAYLQKISQSSTSMNETLDDIIDLRRICRDEIDLRPEPIHIGTLLDQLQNQFTVITAEQGLLFNLQAEEASALNIMADMHALRQIILKLLTCSASYTSQGGRLILNVRPVAMDTDHVSIEISVDSRGITLDQERLTNLFKPYEHFHRNINDNFGALDIALIILKSYALAMGASTLVAESDDTKGTRLSVALDFPLVNAKEDIDAETDGAPLPDFTGKRVLVVDDNTINLEVTAKILSTYGLVVEKAVDGQDALDRYRSASGRFDIILMDILMPVMDGLEVTRAIRAMSDIPGSDHIPIVAMTANAFREDFEESLRSGIDAHLVKPIDPDRLLKIIALLLHLQ